MNLEKFPSCGKCPFFNIGEWFCTLKYGIQCPRDLWKEKFVAQLEAKIKFLEKSGSPTYTIVLLEEVLEAFK